MTRRRSLLALAIAAGVVASWAIFSTERPLPEDLSLETVVDELAGDALSRGVGAQNAADPVRIGTLEPADLLATGGGRRPAILAPPPSRLHWRVDLPTERATLRFAVAVERAGGAKFEGSGIRFTVTIDGERRWTRALDPARHRRDRRWVEAQVTLPPGTGAAREIVLLTETIRPASPPVGTPGWSQVRITRTHRVRRQYAVDGRSLLVLLVDTLRADRLGLYGNVPSPSPTLDALATRGLVFEQALAQSSWTLPSVASLLTGLHPRSHGVLGARSAQGEATAGVLAHEIETWPELAAAAGITTYAVSTNPFFSAGTNLAQGFERMDELPWNPRERSWASAAAVHARFLRFLRANRDLRFVAWLHYMEPHDPYTPPPELRPPPPPGIRPALAAGDVHAAARRLNWAGGPRLSDEEITWLRALYDAEIAGWDRALAELLHALAAEGILGRTTIIVTSDHGEEFQEHGRLKHGSQLYEESLRVPLLLVGPGIPPGRVQALAQGIDLAPTALALLGLPVPPQLPGTDLRRIAADRPERAVFAETASGIAPDGSPTDVRALRLERWKLIDLPALGRRELYDLATDPGERQARGAEDPAATDLAARLAAVVAAAPPPPRGSAAPDPGLLERLRHLGYVE